jgi:SpoIID/LytB domain protein
VTPAALAVTGHGFGHGRGMGQWGALGYAVDHGWSRDRILGHFYGGTTAGTAGNPTITVELSSWRDRAVVVTGPGVSVDGTATGTAAVRVTRTAANAFRVERGSSCSGPWTVWGGSRPGGLVLRSTDPAGIGVCDASTVRGYRGDLQVVERLPGSALVNRLPVDSYLRGVVPREVPASWGDAGSGRGAVALEAQAVAARSYALAGSFAPYAKTCDTTACQVYGGSWTRPVGSTARTSLEDARTTGAVTRTSGLVRLTAGGAIARTEFSSSTGGYSAGGQYPAVVDQGDDVTSNPNHDWSVSIPWAQVQTALGVTALNAVTVTSRNGLGADGGRVLSVAVNHAGGVTTMSGEAFRTALGLRSSWFTVTNSPHPPTDEGRAIAHALYVDLLERQPSTAAIESRASELANGRSVQSMAREFAASQARARIVVDDAYHLALDRPPDDSGMTTWTAEYRRTGDLGLVQAHLFASDEGWARAGGDERAWVARLYTRLLGRAATTTLIDLWVARLHAHGRLYVAEGIANSTPGRARRLTGYFQVMLGRTPADPAASSWVLRPPDAWDVEVPAGIAASAEYRLRAVARYGP